MRSRRDAGAATCASRQLQQANTDIPAVADAHQPQLWLGAARRDRDVAVDGDERSETAWTRHRSDAQGRESRCQKSARASFPPPLPRRRGVSPLSVFSSAPPPALCPDTHNAADPRFPGAGASDCSPYPCAVVA